MLAGHTNSLSLKFAVRQRSVDTAEVRPELNHATNGEWRVNRLIRLRDRISVLWLSVENLFCFHAQLPSSLVGAT